MPKYAVTSTVDVPIPSDFEERWDASDLNRGKGSLTFSGTDVTDWTGQNGTVLTSVSTGTAPTFELDGNFPAVKFNAGKGLARWGTPPTTNATNKTLITVCSIDRAGSASEIIVEAPFGKWRCYGTTYGDKYVGTKLSQSPTTNNFSGRRAVLGITCTHNATDDNDVAFLCGTTTVGTELTLSDANTSLSNRLTFGLQQAGGANATGYVHEILLYDRVLDATELETVSNYLSRKWKCAQSDTASDTPYSFTAPTIPSTGIKARWDASDPEAGSGARTWNTDEATNDLLTWTDQTGTYTLSRAGATTYYAGFYTTSDGYDAIQFFGDGSYRAATTDFSSATQTMLVVQQHDVTAQTGTAYPIHFGTMIVGSSNTTRERGLRISGGSGAERYIPFDAYTPDGTSLRTVTAVRMTHNATDDNDVELFYGLGLANSVTGLSDAATAYGGCALGGHYGTTFEVSGYVNEVIVYNSALSDADLRDAILGLSNKWNAHYLFEPCATENPGYNPTKKYIDITSHLPNDKGAEAETDRIVHELPMSGTPRLSGTNHPVEPIKSVSASVLCHIRADQGLSLSGSDVTSWADLSPSGVDFGVNGGTLTDPSYVENHLGFPAVYFDGTEGLQQDTNVTYGDNYSGYIVYSVPAGASTASHGTRCVVLEHISSEGLLIYPGSTYATGLGASAIEYFTNKDSGAYTYSPLNVARDEIHVMSWSLDDTLTTGTHKAWHNGVKVYDASITNASPNSFPLALASLAAGTYAAECYIYEVGVFNGTLSDADMETIQRAACAYYGVDWMPDETPYLLGLFCGTLPSVTNDCVYWFTADPEYLTLDSDNKKVAEWRMRPEITEHSRTMVATADGLPIFAPKYLNGHGCVNFDGTTVGSTTGEALEDATSYTWTESSIFPAATGCSSFMVARMFNESNSTDFWHGAAYVRQGTGANGYYAHNYSGDAVATSTTNYAGTWVRYLGVYDTSGVHKTAGTHDIYVNTETATQVDGTPTDSGATYAAIGSNNTQTGNGYGAIREVAEWKHPLSTVEKTNLDNYVTYWYDDEGNFGL